MRLGKSLDDALQLADRIRPVLASPFRLSELEIRVDCSIGVALLAGGVEIAEEVLRTAHFALKPPKHLIGTQVYEHNPARAHRRPLTIQQTHTSPTPAAAS